MSVSLSGFCYCTFGSLSLPLISFPFVPFFLIHHLSILLCFSFTLALLPSHVQGPSLCSIDEMMRCYEPAGSFMVICVAWPQLHTTALHVQYRMPHETHRGNDIHYCLFVHYIYFIVIFILLLSPVMFVTVVTKHIWVKMIRNS